MDTGNISSGPAPESFSEPSTTPEPVTPSNPANGQSAEAPNGQAPRQNQGGGGRNRRRRNRRRRGGHGGGQNQPKQAHSQQPQNRGGGTFRNNGQQNRGNVFTGPMDHSYRQSNGEVNGNSMQEQGGRNQRFGRRFRQRFGGRGNPQPMQPAPMPTELLEPVASDDVTRIFAFVEDLFFVTKMNETARKLNVKVAFAKTVDELLERVESDPNGNKPALIIFDLNNVGAKPLSAIPKLKTRFKKSASIMGFVPHVQGDLKVKALEAGCDSVVPRSAFSQSLPQLLRRYGAAEEPQQV